MAIPTTTARRRFYNATGDRYESGRYGDRHMDTYRTFRNETLLSILKDAFGDQQVRILEVGCGTGLSLEYLARASRFSLFGVDASETMLRQAVTKTSNVENPPRLILGDAAHLPYPADLFDVVFATRFIHQFSHEVKRQLLKEFRRVVHRDGLVILEFYARPYHWFRYHLGGRKGRSYEAYFRHYPSRAEVRDIVASPFQIHPLRLVGSRFFAGAAAKLERRLIRAGGLALGGIFLDEYFTVARKR